MFSLDKTYFYIIIIRALFCILKQLRKNNIMSQFIYKTIYSKTVPRFSPMRKEGNKLCIIYPLIYGSVLYVLAYYFYSPRNQTTSCQYKLSKKLVQCIKDAQSVLPS